MTRSMADSVTATDIPPGRFDLVAGYVDGLYAWTDADWLFHHASRLVRITVLGGSTDADVADVESGDLTADQGAAWAKGRVDAGKHPTLYFSRSKWPQIDAARKAVGLPDGSFSIWDADWTGAPHLNFNSVATQWADPAYGSGGHFDVSLVVDYWPGIDPPPVVVQPPPPPQPGNPPPDSPPPFVPGVPPGPPPIDQTRSAWANLAAFLTQDLPAFVAELLRLLGLYKKTP